MFSEYASKFLSTSQGRAGRGDSSAQSSSASSSAAASPRAPSQQSAPVSRLFFSAAEVLPDNDDNPRSIYSPRRNWAVSTSRPLRPRSDIREEDDDDDDDDDDDVMGRQMEEHVPSSRLFPTKRSRLFFKSPPASGSTLVGATNTNNISASSRLQVHDGNDLEVDDNMAGTYTGHLYAAESVIRSSWKPYEDDEEEERHRQEIQAISNAMGDNNANEASEVLSSRNSMESVGLESVLSRTRHQSSPPPARLRFNEHPFPRNMTAATMNATTARRHVFLDEYGEAEEGDTGQAVDANDDIPPSDVAISLPPLLAGDSAVKNATEEARTHPISESSHIPQSFMPLRTNNIEVIEGFVPPRLTDHVPLQSQDTFWSKFYILSMCSLFATSFVIWLETEVTKSISLTDSIYTVVGGSVSILALDTFLAIIISIVWFLVLKSCVRPALYLLVISIPFALLSLTMYPLIMSYRDSWGGNTTQDKAMRWTSLIPALMGVFWIWFAVRSRNALGRAIGIVQLACKILGENPSLIVLSMGTLVSFIAFTWVWFGMFARVFLKGKVVVGTSGITSWILDQNSWVLGAWYILMYLWSWGVFSGVQRVATSETVSQWYFHRHVRPQPSSMAVVSASLSQAGTTFSGTICFASFLALLVRLPILVLPRRAMAIVQTFFSSIIPGPIFAITNPLTLSYAAMTVQSLVPSSRGIASLRFIDLGRHSMYENSWTAYRLSKMLLSSARALTALALGFGAWVHAAQEVNGGSLYGYIVGLMGGAIGWVVLGATEGNLSMIVDSAFVAFAIDQVGNHGGHCREADIQFGGFE
ncbi:hypothetical protein V1517DRAFT_327853 [Lipomyces orientalis]|uniref:Uncharacterized protein n=1 Tax=Lipomyces orientalis TaxID=1233043 RepID=A0ACC3TIB9_9ASCO